jgi:hypothetical protein
MKLFGLMCILAALSACAALHSKRDGFRDGATWNETSWTDEPESYAECGP